MTVLVKIFSFAGCPGRQPARALVERVLDELAPDADLREIAVEDEEAVRVQRFLGSPSIRVEGGDTEPGADQRSDFALSYRLCAGEHGPRGMPPESMLRAALLSADVSA